MFNWMKSKIKLKEVQVGDGLFVPEIKEIYLAEVYNVDDDIPLSPLHHRGRGRIPNKISRTLQILKAGQSFFVPVEIEDKEERQKLRNKIRRIAYAWGKKHGREVAALSTETGVRVWLVK